MLLLVCYSGYIRSNPCTKLFEYIARNTYSKLFFNQPLRWFLVQWLRVLAFFQFPILLYYARLVGENERCLRRNERSCFVFVNLQNKPSWRCWHCVVSNMLSVYWMCMVLGVVTQSIFYLFHVTFNFNFQFCFIMHA